jgi:gliding motility-associated-like protein
MPGYGEGTWILGTGGGFIEPSEIHNPEARVTNLVNGTSTFKWRVEHNGCVIEDEVEVTYGNITPAEAGANVYNLCGDTYSLSANGPFNGIGQWSVIYGSGMFDDVNNPKTKVRGLQKGRNTLQWKITYNSDISVDTIQIWNMSVTDAYAGTDRTICTYEYELQGNAPKEQRLEIHRKENGVDDVIEVLYSQEWELISGGCEFDYPANFTGDKSKIQAKNVQNAKAINLKQGRNKFVYKMFNVINDEKLCYSADTVEIINDKADEAYACGLNNECDTIYTCTGAARLYPNSPTYGDGSWRVASGGSGNFNDNDVYNLGQGANSLIWEIVTETGGQCNSADTVIVVNNTPTPADAGPDDPLAVCGSTSTLSGNKPMYFTRAYWELIEGGGQFIDPATGDTVSRVELRRNDGTENQTVKVVNLAFGNNRFRWVVENEGCQSSDETILNNIFIKAEAGDVSPLCVDSVKLTANNPAPGVGMWSIMGGNGRGSFVDPTDPHTVVRNLGNGYNTLLWTVNYLECPSVDTVVVLNNSATKAMISGGPQSLCDVNSTILTAAPLVASEDSSWYEYGYWEIAEGGGKFLNDSSNTTIVSDIPFNKDGNRYRWTIIRYHKESNFKCISRDDVLVEYNKVEAYAGEDQALCYDNTVLAAHSAGVGTGRWSISGSASSGTFDDETDPTTRISKLGRGENILRWTTSYKGCEDYDEVTIINGMPSKPYAGQPQETCYDEVTLEAHPAEPGEIGVWSTVAGSMPWNEDNINVHNATILTEKGDNTYRWTLVKETPIYRGVDENGDPFYDPLKCYLSDDVVISNQRPSEPFAGVDKAICSSSYPLKAVTPSYGEGIWTIEEGGGKIADPKSPETMVTNLAYGKTRFKWTLTVDNNCPLFKEVTIINGSPSDADAGPDSEDCSSESVLDANVPAVGEGMWSILSGAEGTIADPFDPKTSVSNLIFGENKFLWVIKNTTTGFDGNTFQCESQDTVSVWNMIPDQANAADDQLKCKDYTVMNANRPSVGHGYWRLLQGSGEFKDSTDAKTSVTGLGYGENIFRWTISFGECITEDDVVVYSQKAEPYAGENDVTYTDSYRLNAGNPGRLPGYWQYLGSSEEIVFEDSTDFHTMVRGLSRGVNTFRWVIDVDECHTFDEVSIVYKVVPLAGFTADTLQGCSPLTVRFSDESIEAKQYKWDFGDGTTSNIRNPMHTFQLPGNYEVILTVPGPDGKDSKYTQFVRVYGHPTASFDAAPQLVYMPDDKVYFVNHSEGASEYEWSFGDGGYSSDKNPSYLYQGEGLYTVTLRVWNEFGCDADTTKESFIEARRGGFIVFPNTFAPRNELNGNVSIFGVNATFRPVYQDVTSFHMQIFNRWGQLIFETDDINEGWDGRFNGDIAPEGVYVWVAKGRFVSGKEYNKSGQVLIVK